MDMASSILDVRDLLGDETTSLEVANETRRDRFTEWVCQGANFPRDSHRQLFRLVPSDSPPQLHPITLITQHTFCGHAS
jgi:hypothetical protein